MHKGYGSPLMASAELDEKFGRDGWTCSPRFVIEQASGKLRPIDDGHRSGVNDATSVVEKLVLCSALQPAVCARLLEQEARSMEFDIKGQEILFLQDESASVVVEFVLNLLLPDLELLLFDAVPLL